MLNVTDLHGFLKNTRISRSSNIYSFVDINEIVAERDPKQPRSIQMLRKIQFQTDDIQKLISAFVDLVRGKKVLQITDAGDIPVYFDPDMIVDNEHIIQLILEKCEIDNHILEIQ